jgi:MFS family permease
MPSPSDHDQPHMEALAANTSSGELRVSNWHTRLTSGFDSLRVRNYRLFWIGQLVSLTGSWMQFTAQAWLVLILTPSPFAVGLVTTLQWLPVTLFSLVGGVLIDRMDRHRLLIATQTAAMVTALVFGALVGLNIIKLWHIYVLALLQGCTNALDLPLRHSFAVELVKQDQRINVVALNSISINVTRVLGPALAGILITPIGIAAILFINAASFVAVIWALLRMDRLSFFNELHQQTSGSMGQRLREGLAYTLHTSDILLVMIVVAAVGTFGFNFGVILPLIAKFVVRTNAAGFGALTSLMGIGSLAASITAAYTHVVTTRRLLTTAAAFSAVLGAVAFAQAFVLSSLLLMALGFFGILFAVTASSLIQLTVPNGLRGRVTSLYLLLFMGSTPVGGLLIGALSETIGVPRTLLVCSLLCLLGIAGAFLFHRYKGNRLSSAAAT